MCVSHLSFIFKQGEACPANWNPGDSTIMLMNKDDMDEMDEMDEMVDNISWRHNHHVDE